MILRGLALAFVLTFASHLFADLPEGVEMLANVPFGKGGDRTLSMHVLRPKTTPPKPMPALVYIHGGAWESGDKKNGLVHLAPFAARGYFCATIEYRFSKEALFPAQIEDCKCAIRFLRSRAKDFHLDPDRIGVWGTSAGGHLASLMGTSAGVKELEGSGGWSDVPSHVQAVCDFCGPSDFVAWGDHAHPAVFRLLGGKVSERLEQAKSASPVTYIRKDPPPFLIVHGDKDTVVPLKQSEILRDALRKAGGTVELHILEGVNHDAVSPRSYKLAADFFDKHLQPPAQK